MNLTKQEITHHLGIENLSAHLAGNFYPFVSFANNSIPTAGSGTMKRSRLIEHKLFVDMLDIVMHQTGDFTIKTKSGNVRFWRVK